MTSNTCRLVMLPHVGWRLVLSVPADLHQPDDFVPVRVDLRELPPLLELAPLGTQHHLEDGGLAPLRRRFKRVPRFTSTARLEKPVFVRQVAVLPEGTRRDQTSQGPVGKAVPGDTEIVRQG